MGRATVFWVCAMMMAGGFLASVDAGPCAISTEAAVVFEDEFNDGYSGWTIDHDSGTAWVWDDGAMLNEFGYPSAGSLISPVINCTGVEGASLSFYSFWDATYATGEQYGYIRGSVDGGATWPYLLFTMVDQTEHDATLSVATPWADGAGAVRFRFYVYNFDNWYWRVDDFALSADVAPPPPPEYFTPWETDCTDASGWTANGLWHQVDSGDAGCPPWNISMSADRAWWYGRDDTGDYATGARVSGSLTSPIMSSKLGEEVWLDFQSWHETDGRDGYDERRVSVVDDSGAEHPVATLEGGAMDEWVRTSLNLTGLLPDPSPEVFAADKVGEVLVPSLAQESMGVYSGSIVEVGGTQMMYYMARDASGLRRILLATSTDGMSWTKQGVVLSGGAEVSFGDVIQPCVIVDEGVFKMWYVAKPNPPAFAVFYATSSDGYSWVKHGYVLACGPETYDATSINRCWVVKEDGAYRMWYSGQDASSIYRICHASSPDGIAWTKEGVLMEGEGAEESAGVLSPCVAMLPDGRYAMWYTSLDVKYRIKFATSDDGLAWEGKTLHLDYGDVAYDPDGVYNPIVRIVGCQILIYYTSTDWDGPESISLARSVFALPMDPVEPGVKQGVVLGVSLPQESVAAVPGSVILVDGTYQMYYFARDSFSTSRILRATSQDGRSWAKDGVVMEADAVDGGGSLFDPCVIYDGGVYKMWYVGQPVLPDTEVFYATSADGLSWTKHGLVLASGPEAFDAANIVRCWVIKDGGEYRMWYGGVDASSNRRICYATSPDGIAWTKQGIAVYDDADYESDGVMHPCVAKAEDGRYVMWYTALSTKYRIKCVSSMDGIAWTGKQLYLNYGDMGDTDGVSYPTALLSGEGVMAYYSSVRWTSAEVVSLATSSLPAMRNQWRVRFTFDSVDSIGNAHQGWYVDDLAFGSGSTMKIAYSAGWNLLSFPTNLAGMPIGEALADEWDNIACIQTYDSSAGRWLSYSPDSPPWMNGIDSIEPGRGYWIEFRDDGDGVLAVRYSPLAGLSVPMRAGWNLVGFPADGSPSLAMLLAGVPWDMAQKGDEASAYHLKSIAGTYAVEPDEGYWIHVTEDCEVFIG